MLYLQTSMIMSIFTKYNEKETKRQSKADSKKKKAINHDQRGQIKFCTSYTISKLQFGWVKATAAVSNIFPRRQA